MPCVKAPSRAFIITEHAPQQLCIQYESITSADSVIAVDGGLQTVDRLGLSPSLIIGDLDSVSPSLLVKYISTQVIRHPVRKNETDTELAVLWCLQQGCYSELIICNNLQGRFDHALALLQNLLVVSRGKKTYPQARIDTGTQVLFLLEAENLLRYPLGTLLSLVPLSAKVHLESSEGLRYPLKGLVLSQAQSRGISNEFTNSPVRIRKTSGTALAIVTPS